MSVKDIETLWNEIDKKSDQFVKDEKAKLGDWRTKRKRSEKPWTGIALSGGGIRSATFCLGALQALANRDRLKCFDYMSTVSGGGFIGSSLQWWWSNKHNEANDNSVGNEIADWIAKQYRKFIKRNIDKSDPSEIKGVSGLGPEDFPYGTAHPDPAERIKPDRSEQIKILDYLRNHGNYLVPGNGINIWSGISVVIRSVLLNLLIWIPLAALLFYWISKVPDVVTRKLLDRLPNGGSPLPNSIIAPGWRDVSASEPVLKAVHALPGVYALAIWAAFAMILIYILGCIFYSLQTSSTRESANNKWNLRDTISTVAAAISLVGASWFYNIVPDYGWLNAILVVVGFIGFARLMKTIIFIFGVKDMGHAYRLRRFFEKQVGAFFKFFLLMLALGLVPVVFKLVFTTSSAPGVTGLFAVSLGTATALWGHYQTMRKLDSGLASKIILPIGAALFLFGVLVLGYEIAMVLKDTSILNAEFKGDKFVFPQMSSQIDKWIKLGIWAAMFLALVSAIFANTNQISLNRFYRDRLIEAYMPNVSAVNSGQVGRTPVAERLRMGEFWSPDTSMGPYPLVNTNVVLINDDDKTVRLRGGDNYVLSPYYCGSAATGWYNTDNKASRHITLASAMTASAAAANPNAGYVGTGPTRGRLISIVMMLLNIRLGYWIPNPANQKRFNKPNHIKPGAAYALTTEGFRRDSDFLELSDGGHFDNLGIYELVRRRCKLIVVCDGEADVEASYSALVSVQRRIEQDFNATIIFTENGGPELLAADLPMKYPSGALQAEQPYFTAKIRYRDNFEGMIIYMKATMIDDLSFKVKGYKGAHPTFPHESTADQFFNPEQFEAYRELGYRTGMKMMDDLGPDWNIDDVDLVLAAMNDTAKSKK